MNEQERPLFDEISEILASPMPRREAFRLIFRLLLATCLAALWPTRANAQRVSGMDQVVSDFSMTGARVSDVVDRLRDSEHVPLSFIEAPHDSRVTIRMARGTVRDLLQQIVRQSPQYRWTVLNGRLVLLPNRPEFSATVTGVLITERPRLEAADRYIEYLQRQVTAFQQLHGVVMRGNPNAPVFTTAVSLSATATVLEHFVEILGADPGVVFSVRPAPAGGAVFLLNQVELPVVKLSQAAQCRGLSATYANQRDLGCEGGRCGARIQFDVTAVTACAGDNCAGRRVTETVASDNGCGPGAVTTGPGCSIEAGNTVRECTDTYGLCGPAAGFPAGGCTEVYTQRLSVDGRLTDTCTITFRIRREGGTCTGTVARACTHENRACYDTVCCAGDTPNCVDCPGGGRRCCRAGQVCIRGARELECSAKRP